LHWNSSRFGSTLFRLGSTTLLISAMMNGGQRAPAGIKLNYYY